MRGLEASGLIVKTRNGSIRSGMVTGKKIFLARPASDVPCAYGRWVVVAVAKAEAHIVAFLILLILTVNLGGLIVVIGVV